MILMSAICDFVKLWLHNIVAPSHCHDHKVGHFEINSKSFNFVSRLEPHYYGPLRDCARVTLLVR